VPIPRQAESSTSAEATNHPAYLALCCLGAGNPGSIPLNARGYRYLYVAIDKFTKWVEVEPVCTIPARSVVMFICGRVCHFGVPNRIITDNGS
jgi:hypothetical protein